VVVVGMLKPTRAMMGVEAKDVFVGNQALNRRNLTLEYSIAKKYGTITDWTYFERFISFQLNHELGVSPSDHVVLLIENGHALQLTRERRRK
jgi:actin-related protein